MFVKASLAPTLPVPKNEGNYSEFTDSSSKQQLRSTATTWRLLAAVTPQIFEDSLLGLSWDLEQIFAAPNHGSTWRST